MATKAACISIAEAAKEVENGGIARALMKLGRNWMIYNFFLLIIIFHLSFKAQKWHEVYLYKVCFCCCARLLLGETALPVWQQQQQQQQHHAHKSADNKIVFSSVLYANSFIWLGVMSKGAADLCKLSEPNSSGNGRILCDRLGEMNDRPPALIIG